MMMSRKASKRVCFSPDVNNNENTNNGTKLGRQTKMVIGILGFRQPRNSGISPAGMGLLRSIEAKFVKAFRFVSIRRSSRKFSSSSLTLARSRSYAEIIDSHRVEAIEDCIEFLNSSSSSSSSSSFSSLQRSNSVSANSSC